MSSDQQILLDRMADMLDKLWRSAKLSPVQGITGQMVGMEMHRIELQGFTLGEIEDLLHDYATLI